MNTVNPKITACVSFLVKDNKVLLGIATAGPCKAKRNGPGGKYEKGETLHGGNEREVSEEFGVTLHRVETFCYGCVDFYFRDKKRPDKRPDNPKVRMYIFVSEGWVDNPKREEDHKKPEMTDFQWYPINALPYSEMSAGDTLWLPQVLEGLHVTGFVYFGDTVDEVLDKYLVFSEHPAELPPLHL